MTRPPTRTRSQSAGFTLIELMLTVMVAAILLGIGVPSFTNIIRNNRLTTAANDLLRSTQLARSEAIKRQVPVVVCASADATAESPSCSDGDFSQWIVFVDSNGNWSLDNLEPVLEQHGAVHSSVTVRNDNDGIISYAASGFATPLPPAGTTPARNIVICDARGNQQFGANDSTARAVMIEATGRARVTKNLADVSVAIDAAGDCPR